MDDRIVSRHSDRDRSILLLPNESERVEFELTSDDMERGRLMLSWDAAHTAVGSGYNHKLLVRLNGRIVNAWVDRVTTRLINKPAAGFEYPGEGTQSWSLTDQGWVVPVHAADGAIPSWLGDSGTRFTVAVDDLIHPGRNTLNFTRLDEDSSVPIRVSDVSVAIDTSIDGQSTVGINETPIDSIGAFDVRVRIAAAERLLIDAGRDTVAVGTSFTAEGGLISIKLGDESAIVAPEVVSVVRAVSFEPPFVEITDRICNTSDADVGVVVRHTLAMHDGTAFRHARLCGMHDPELRRSREAGNPTVFAALGAGVDSPGVGLIAEDDVLRNHGDYAFTEAGGLAITDQRLLVAVGSEHTTRLLVYIGGGSYWDMIRALRARWQVPTVRVPLAAAFLSPGRFAGETPETIRAWIERSGFGLVVLTVDAVDADGRDIPPLGVGWDDVRLASWLDDLASVRRTLRDAAPDMPVLLKVHSYFNSPQRDVYADRYADAIMRDTSGEIIAHRVWGPVFVPTTENRFGRDFAEVIRRIADRIDADGYYWDEFTLPGLGIDRDLTTHAHDGVTALVDDAGALVGHAAEVDLLSHDYRLKLVKEELARGKIVLLGGEPRSMAFQRLPVLWWREAQDTARVASVTHLAQGMVYTHGYHPPDAWRIVERSAIASRISASNWPALARDVFPITPVDRGPGWVRGQGVLVTARSGRFAWPASWAAPIGTVYLPTGRAE